MRTVRFSHPITIDGVSYAVGQVVSLPDKTAKSLVSSGMAVYTDGAVTPTNPMLRASDISTEGTLMQSAIAGIAGRIGGRRRRPRPRGESVLWGGQQSHGFTVGGAGVASSALEDTADKAQGYCSIRLTTKGDHTQSTIQRLAMPAFNLTNRALCVWLKVENFNEGCDFRVYAGSSGAAWTATLNWSIADSGPYKYTLPGSGEWIRLILPRSKATTTGTPTITALTDVRVVLYDNGVVSGGGAMTVRLGGVSTVPDTTTLYPNGVVSLTFDDGIVDQFTEGKAYMDRYGYSGTIYPIIEMLGTAGYMTSAQLRAMHDDSGWEVGLHSYTAAGHNGTGGLTGLTSAERKAEITRSRAWLLDHGYPNPEHLAYPQGAFDAATIADLSPLVASARTTKSIQRETVPPGEPMMLYTRALSSTDTAATITALIDAVVANKEWLPLTFHHLRTSPPSTGTTPTIFRAIVDHCATSGVAVRTVGEVLAAGYA